MGNAAQQFYNEGKHEGIAEGVKKGIEKRNYEIAITMLRAGSDITFVSTVTGLSMLEIQKLKAKL